MNAYNNWIKQNITNTYGQCAEATLAMQQAFPELTRVRGHYYDCLWGQREHWWLVTKDGQIVDPTKSQFPSKGFGTYTKLPDDTPEPSGICMNCGDYCYYHKDPKAYSSSHFCSQRCEALVMADFR